MLTMGKRKKSTATSAAAAPKTVAALASFPPHLLEASKPLGKHHPFGKIQCLCPGMIWVQSGFLTPRECQEWITWSADSRDNHRGRDGRWTYTSHPATRYIAHRECFRIQGDDGSLAQKIFQRLQASGLLKVLHAELDLPPSYQAVACNPNIRLYKYTKGMSFGKHIDESNTTGAGQTEITLLVYLSDCQGGATSFYRNNGTALAFEPQVGAVLLHVHGDRCLVHEANPVESGVKYILRSDVCYRHV